MVAWQRFAAVANPSTGHRQRRLHVEVNDSVALPQPDAPGMLRR